MSPIDPACASRSVRAGRQRPAAQLDFYERVLGLPRLARASPARRPSGPTASARRCCSSELEPSHSGRRRAAPGLFHVAWLHPTRAALAASVRRVAGEGWRFDGASDHGVSEALYLRDPDGLGIELYADRPREQLGSGRRAAAAWRW